MEQPVKVKRHYAQQIRKNGYTLAVSIAITLCIGVIVFLVGMQNIKGQAERYAADVEADYTSLMLSYTRTFDVVYDTIVDKIKEDPSFEEMDAWLKSKDQDFQEAMGSEIYDGIAITYKEGYAHSWNYGDYSDYDPTSRRWYQVAKEADGKTAIVAPYVTFLDAQFSNDDSYILMSVVRKYSNEIYFDYDIKIKEIGGLLENRKALYDGNSLVLYDADGYILSSSREELFAHNVHTTDDVITSGIDRAFQKMEEKPGKLQFAIVDGVAKCMYLSYDENQNAICMTIPLLSIVRQDFLAILLVVLILLFFETFIYKRGIRSLVEYNNRDEQMSAITNATYLSRLFIRMDDMTFYGNEEAKKVCPDNSYSSYYQYMRNRITNENEQKVFEDYVSPDVLRNATDEVNQIQTKRFSVDAELSDGSKQQSTVELSRMFAIREGKKTACLLVRDVTESAEILKEALKQAQNANQAKSGFLSRMIHEIRTPMNAIVGLTTIAKQHKDDAGKIEDYLTKIETSSKVLLNIINDVLDMSAIENNKLKIADEEFDIKHILTSLSTIYYPQCESKGIRFEMATDLDDEIFRGDSLRVSQILLNFVSNAYKFTDRGGTIRISVQETSRRDQTAFIRFQVSDTGAGMTKDMQERLFRPFEQEAATTAKKHGGSGLGLSIAKNLVDLMHGAVRVESEKGKGTTFTVDLPFEITNQKHKMDAEKLHTIRILEVDDDPAAREYTSIVLKRIGVAFETANSGEQALQMLLQAEQAGRPYDVVMLDWRMPGLDGIEVTKHIRKDMENDTTIIIVSAYDLNEVEDEAKAAGADHFVSKPLFQSTVFNILMSLSGGQLRNETAEPEAYDFTGYRALMAEDNDLNAEIATELLDMVNLTVERAENGKLAVETFTNTQPGTYDVILMDMQMPVMDGCEATRAIRALDRADAKTIPIFAMTANAFTEDVSQALSAGMNGHIAKPIDTESLYQTLADVLLKK